MVCLTATFVVFVCAGLILLCPAAEVLDNRQPCSLCGSPIDVTLTVRNEILQPNVEFSATLNGTAQRELVFLLQEAAELDGRFNFTVTYRRRLGFFLESINNWKGDYANDMSWWHIYSEQGPTVGGAHCEGISAYVPQHKEFVVFLLTSWNIPLSACPTEPALIG